jgi:hypothetical protein
MQDSNTINFMNLDNIGVSTVKDSTAFKKIQFFSKTNPSNLFSIKSDFQNSFNKINSFYINDVLLNKSNSYGMDRQHTYTSLSSSLPMFSTLVDYKSVNKLFTYNLNNEWKFRKNPIEVNRLSYNNNLGLNGKQDGLVNNLNKTLPSKYKTIINSTDFSITTSTPNIFSIQTLITILNNILMFLSLHLTLSIGKSTYLITILY